MCEWTDPEDPRWKNTGWYNVFVERTEYVLQFCKNKVVLDSCCGCGWSTYKIAQVAQKVVGIDVCEEALRVAREKYNASNIVYKKMNALKMEFDDEVFDTVVSLESIEHFDRSSVKTYLAEIKRVLKKNGVLVGSTPYARTFIHEYIYLKRNKYHKKLYNKGSLIHLLQNFFYEVRVFIKKDNNYMLFYCKNQ